MPAYLHDDFLLSTPSARRLYHEVAAPLPIIDYHSHLPPDDVANDRRFANLHELWLEGDHYKWRAMRANGIDEALITGAADPFDKFMAYAATMPRTLRNPLHHWSHLELRRAFGIQEVLNESTARGIWDAANEKLASPEFTARGFLKHFRVEISCTTDDPVDALLSHQKIAADGFTTRVLPTFRPDKALQVDQPTYRAWIQKLELAAGFPIRKLSNLIAALGARHDFFAKNGCRLSDHGLPYCFADHCEEDTAEAIFAKAINGRLVTTGERDAFASYLMIEFARWDHAKNWTKQLHLGPFRNVNTRRFRALGADSGFDTIGDLPQGEALVRYLDRIDSAGILPKTILYNINPNDNHLFAGLTGSFQGGGVPGRIQHGAAWWFLDQKDGIETQLNVLSQLGLLSRFVGMLTDSRSFLSFPRHEYFRRILCNLVGRDLDEGLLPDDWALVSGLVADVCYHNARGHFGFYDGAM